MKSKKPTRTTNISIPTFDEGISSFTPVEIHRRIVQPMATVLDRYCVADRAESSGGSDEYREANAGIRLAKSLETDPMAFRPEDLERFALNYDDKVPTLSSALRRMAAMQAIVAARFSIWGSTPNEYVDRCGWHVANCIMQAKEFDEDSKRIVFIWLDNLRKTRRYDLEKMLRTALDRRPRLASNALA